MISKTEAMKPERSTTAGEGEGEGEGEELKLVGEMIPNANSSHFTCNFTAMYSINQSTSSV
jgi:hypothetical protein